MNNAKEKNKLLRDRYFKFRINFFWDENDEPMTVERIHGITGISENLLGDFFRGKDLNKEEFEMLDDFLKHYGY